MSKHSSADRRRDEADVVLFLGFDGVLHPQEAANDCRRDRVHGDALFTYAPCLVEILEPYLPHVDVVVTSSWGRQCSLQDLRRHLPQALAQRVTANLWDETPPRELSQYDHIRYWLARRYIPSPPPWLAIGHDVTDWPLDQRRNLIDCSETIHAARTQEAVRAAFRRYNWSELWWGEGRAPSLELRNQARSLMSMWSVPRAKWPQLLGTRCDDFEARLDLLLTIRAGVRVREDAEKWLPHWVHLPQRELGLRRPIDVMAEDIQGIERVLQFVWQKGAR